MPGRRETTTVITRTRYIAALGFSLGCHATLLLVLMLLPAGRVPLGSERPIVVAVLGDDGAGRDGSADASATAEAPHESEPRHAPVEPAARAPRPPVSAPAAARPPRHARSAARPATPPATWPLAAAPAAAISASEATRSDARGAIAPAGGTTVANGEAGQGGGVAGEGRGVAGTGRGAGDLRPWCIVCPIPDYPARARREGWQGTVDVELHVGRDGAVEYASIGRSSGFAVLDSAAVTVARRSRFRGAEGAELRGQLRYRFVLDGPADRPL